MPKFPRMKIKDNPFIVKGYSNDNLFCDRQKETEQLFRNVVNGNDTTLISPRKYGKTGLILHFYDYIKKSQSDYETLYIDIFPTRSLSDFIRILSEAILQKFPEKTSIGEKFMNILKGFRPLISYDPLSGVPQIQINYQLPSEKEYTLQGLLGFLNAQDQPIILAIDEFQQITEYPEANVEALLRTYTQQFHNLRFIFCGSNQTIMSDMFHNAKRPFFSSTKMISLEKIDVNIYENFITHLFDNYEINVQSDAIKYILSWTKCHTFYTQCLCNTAFSLCDNELTMDIVKKSCSEILDNNETTYLQYRKMLTNSQWNFLIAVAKEDGIQQITSTKFLTTYHIGGSTTSRRNAQSLVDKELLLTITEKQQILYQVYDVFFARWLQREY